MLLDVMVPARSTDFEMCAQTYAAVQNSVKTTVKVFDLDIFYVTYNRVPDRNSAKIVDFSYCPCQYV